jgi:hypothetical protein
MLQQQCSTPSLWRRHTRTQDSLGLQLIVILNTEFVENNLSVSSSLCSLHNGVLNLLASVRGNVKRERMKHSEFVAVLQLSLVFIKHVQDNL